MRCSCRRASKPSTVARRAASVVMRLIRRARASVLMVFGSRTAYGIDNHIRLTVADEVQKVRALLSDFYNKLAVNAFVFKHGFCSRSCVKRKAKGFQACRKRNKRFFVLVRYRQNDIAGYRNGDSCAGLGFKESHAEAPVNAHNFASGTHFRSELDLRSGETLKRNDRFFYRAVHKFRFFREIHILQRKPRHDFCRNARDIASCRL